MRDIVNLRTSATSWLHIKCAAPWREPSVAALLLILGPSSPRELKHQSACYMAFSGAPGAPQSAMQGTTGHRNTANGTWPGKATPYASAFMVPSAWPMLSLVR